MMKLGGERSASIACTQKLARGATRAQYSQYGVTLTILVVESNDNVTVLYRDD